MRRHHRYIVLLIIVIVTALVYSRALQNGFLLWDDDAHVTNNPDIQSLSLDNIKTIFTSYYVSMYHPLVTLSFALEYHFFGLHPAVYHATNVLFHLANVVLVFFLVHSLSQRHEPALIAACLFGLHPMHVESVAWITERKDVVYAFFYLSALIFYLRFLRQGKARQYGMALFCFVLSLCSKTTAMTLPLVLFLMDAYGRRKATGRTLLEKLPFVMLALVCGLIALHSQAGSTRYVLGSSFTFIDRMFLAAYALCYYLVHVFLPMNLSALHLMPIKAEGLLPVIYYLAPLPLILLAFLGTRKGFLQREYVFGLLFFAVILSLNIHVIPIGMSVVSERYTYLAYVGLYYILGQMYCAALDRYRNILLRWKKPMTAGAVLLALFFGSLTYQRLGTWNSTLVLFQDAAMKTRNTTEANFIQTLAYEFEGNEKSRNKLYKESIDWFNKAIDLSPKLPELYLGRGISQHYLLHDTAAINDYNKALELDSSFAPAYFDRAVVYLLWNRPEEACADLWAAYRLGMHNAFSLAQANCF